MALNPLHVAVIVKPTANYNARDTRNMGLWSYAVDEFTWEFIPLGKGKQVDTDDFKAQGFDLVFHEDGGSWCEYIGDAIPVIYYSIDSTLSDANHYQPRLEQAAKADLVCVDHDDLDRFKSGSQPVRRLGYCVNDKLFTPADNKPIDVCFHCGGTPNRHPYRVRLSELCKARGLRYVSGTTDLASYAREMGQAKVVVNVPRTPTNRPHRVLDAMSSGAALVTLPIPDVSGEVRRAGQHYLATTDEYLEEHVRVLIENNTWELLAIEGQKLVQQRHTWAVRAKELRGMLNCELGV